MLHAKKTWFIVCTLARTKDEMKKEFHCRKPYEERVNVVPPPVGFAGEEELPVNVYAQKLGKCMRHAHHHSHMPCDICDPPLFHASHQGTHSTRKAAEKPMLMIAKPIGDSSRPSTARYSVSTPKNPEFTMINTSAGCEEQERTNTHVKSQLNLLTEGLASTIALLNSTTRKQQNDYQSERRLMT
eukprot:2082539-Amphidinium_carterae.2